MLPLKVTIRGFFSYRDTVTFDFSDRPLWMLSGDNGAGKSTVFDAITFALFRKHRGGGSDFKELVNRACDEGEVNVEFEAGGKRYLATRTVTKRGTTNASLTWHDGSVWRGVEGSDGLNGFDTTITRILGMNHDAFCSSVLLRQGDADRLISVQPKDRYEVLTQIVDLSAYRALHERAKGVQDYLNVRVRHIDADLKGVEEVSDEQIADATAAIEQAVEAVEKADSEANRLQTLAGQAKEFEKLSAEQKGLQEEIEKADALLTHAEAVIRDAERWAELNIVLPTLTDITAERGRRDKIAREEKQAEEKVAEEKRAIAPRVGLDPGDADDAFLARLAEEIQHIETVQKALSPLKRYAIARTEGHNARDEFQRFQENAPPPVTGTAEEECAEAISAVAEADRRERAAAEKVSNAKRDVDDLEKRRQRLTDAGTETECLYCGQPLSDERRAEEAANIEGLIETAQHIHSKAQAAQEEARATLSKAKRTEASARADYETRKENYRLYQQDCSNARTRQNNARKTAREAVEELPAPFAAKVICPKVDGTDDKLYLDSLFPAEEDLNRLAAETALLKERHGQRNALVDDCRQRDQKAQEVVAAETRLSEWRERLTEDWAIMANTLDATGLEALQDEQAALRGADTRRHQLEGARARCEEWQKQFGKVTNALTELPEEAWCPSAEVEQKATHAASIQKSARDAALEARQQAKSLTDTRYRRCTLLDRREAMKRRADHIATLTQLLSRDNLQNYLLRGAEEAMVANANEALAAFSDGMLRLERRGDTGDSKQEALDLVCHNSESAQEPLPLWNLSGSQRFRVAVSLALGIGRYAGGTDGRIRSVIIDEGFGSLDPRNQGIMVDEIKALAASRATGLGLERIIVVSHQDTIADAFMDRFHIRLTDVGSVAERIIA